jgi:hypothetical protein
MVVGSSKTLHRKRVANVEKMPLNEGAISLLQNIPR